MKTRDVYINIEYILGMPAEDLYKKISMLPDESVLFYLPYNIGNKNQFYKAQPLFRGYYEHASAPIFCKTTDKYFSWLRPGQSKIHGPCL